MNGDMNFLDAADEAVFGEAKQAMTARMLRQFGQAGPMSMGMGQQPQAGAPNPQQPPGMGQQPQPQPQPQQTMPAPAPQRQTPADYYAQANEVRQRAYGLEPDPQVMEAERSKAQSNIGYGSAISALGTERMRPTGGAVLRQALQRQGELETDPEKEVARKVRSLENDARFLEQRAQYAQSVEDKAALQRQAQEARAEAQRERFAAEERNARLVASLRPQPQEPMVPVVDDNGNTIYLPRSQAAGMRVPPKGGVGAGGRTLSPKAVEDISAAEGKVEQFDRLKSSWQSGYGGAGTGIGNVWGKYSPAASDASRAQSAWWQDYQSFVNEMRHGQFGAALTPPEKAEFEKSVVTSDTDPRQVENFLDAQHALAKRAKERFVGNLGRAGYDVSGFGAPEQRQSPQTGPRIPSGVTVTRER